MSSISTEPVNHVTEIADVGSVQALIGTGIDDYLGGVAGGLLEPGGKLAFTVATDAVARALGWKLAAEYGLDTTGATPHTDVQVQAWLDAGIPYATGTITCTGTVTIKTDADLHLLTLNYTGTGTALRVGDPGAQLYRKTILCPQVVATAKTVTGWAQVAGSVGVQVSNAYGCTITFPRVLNFETGVLVTGVPIGAAIQGTQQCALHPLHLDNNKVNFKIAPYVGTTQADSGWSNQNAVFGGRMTHNSNEGVQVSGSAHVVMADCPNIVNGWAFYGTSLESPDVVEFHVDTYSQYCTFSDCRWENTGGDTHRRVRSRGIAKANRILGGFNAGQLTQVLTDTARPFNTDTDVVTSRTGGNSTLPTLMLENPVSSTGPILTVMAAGAGAAASDPTTAWCVRATSQQWAGKRSTDTYARTIVDYLNGRLYVGDSVSAAPVAFFTGTPTAMALGGGVSLLPLANGTQDLGNSGLQWRDLRLSRDIYLGGSIKFGTDNTTDVGAISSLRPRYVRAGTALVTGAAVTGSRPAAATAGEGAMFFDTTLGKPIWSTGSAWVDATGATV